MKKVVWKRNFDLQETLREKYFYEVEYKPQTENPHDQISKE